MDDDVAGLLGALGVGQPVLVVAVDVVVVSGGAGGGEERPYEVHGRGGEGAAAEAEEEAGDDDEDVLGAVLGGRGGDLRLDGGERHGAADLVRAEAADAEDGDDCGGERRRVGGVRVRPEDGGEGDEERLRVAARARVGDEGSRQDGGDQEEELAGGGHGGDYASDFGGGGGIGGREGGVVLVGERGNFRRLGTFDLVGWGNCRASKRRGPRLRHFYALVLVLSGYIIE